MTFLVLLLDDVGYIGTVWYDLNEKDWAGGVSVMKRGILDQYDTVG
jgi:hypothetical protein